ncbi:MAG: hypothetical protein M1826_003221 [Phylliscum demangeonii]|nr:MAG: hypothetical protein M1826_003221 [Phylliscum demangeonii]
MASKPSFPTIMPISQIDGVLFTLYAVAVVTTVLRLYCRGFVLHAFGLDDVLITVAVVFGAAVTALYHLKLATLLDFYHAFTGNPAKFKSPQASLKILAPSFRYAFLQLIFYVVELGLIKLAILAFYRRVAVARAHLYVLYTAALVVICFTIIFVMLTIFAMDPVQGNWDVTKIKRARFRPETLDIVNSSFQAVLDVILLVLPIFLVIRLNTNRKAKIALVILFSFSILSVAATIVRLSKAVQFSNTNNTIQSILRQPGYGVWTAVELNVAIVCANMPGIWTLVKWLMQGRSLDKRASAYEKYQHSGSPARAPSDSRINLGQKGAVVSAVSGGRMGSSGSESGRAGAITRKMEVSMDVEARERQLVHEVA